MTREDKELLLKDLCARLPYGVITKNCKSNFDVPAYHLPDVNGIKQLIAKYDLKPYLRPMSSMTDEEINEFYKIYIGTLNDNFINLPIEQRNAIDAAIYAEFYNSHHLDYHCLIEKGLALEAPEGMYKN